MAEIAPPERLAPVLKLYSTLEDMLYDLDLAAIEIDASAIPAPPVKIEKISNTTELLQFIAYIKKFELFRFNKCYRYLIKAEAPLVTLDAMIGMTTIKSTIVTQVIYYAKKLGQGDGTLDFKSVIHLNTAIYGSPGCGKTTVAQIIGEIYRCLGVVTTNKFIVGRRDNMIGKYLGQTAPLTRAVLESAKGGILFLDEVYQFGSSADGNRDSFAKELVDTINQYITDNPGKVVIIVAGYRDEVKSCFFSQNKGLERRFRWSYSIPDYGAQDLLRIFHKQAHDSRYTVIAPMLSLPDSHVDPPESAGKKRPRAKESAGERFFKDNLLLFKYGGGDTETFLDKCKMVNEKRTIAETSDEGKITNEDILVGFAEYKKYVDDRAHADSAPPPGMYR